MLVFRKEILAMISNELNKRLVNYGQAVARVHNLERALLATTQTADANDLRLDELCKRVVKLEKSTGTQATPVQGGLPVTSDKRIGELREELAKRTHEVECTKTKLRLLGVHDV